jgi:polar amino acid transport system substrate-binding protein
LLTTGKLRAAIVITSSLQVTQSSVKSAQLEGVAPTLGRDLARRLGVPLELVAYRTAAELMDSVAARGWDIAFLGIDPARTQQLRFSEPYMEAGLTYMVAPRSTIRSVSDADRPGVRIAVLAKSPSDLFLSRNLKHAQLMRSAGGPDCTFALLASGQANAFAATPELLHRYLDKLPGSVIVNGHFTTLAQAIAVRSEHAAALVPLTGLLDEAKRSGVVTQAIQNAGLRGVSVAAASAP